MAFNTSISGLRAAQQEMGVISNNIANIGTTGFKRSDAFDFRRALLCVFWVVLVGSPAPA